MRLPANRSPFPTELAENEAGAPLPGAVKPGTARSVTIQPENPARASCKNESRNGVPMIRLASLLIAAFVAHGVAAESVTLTAADGVKVFGEVWRTNASNAPIILAFHQ